MKIAVTARNQVHAFHCEPGDKILHAGLRSGIALPYECGTGTCGTCKARLVEGDIFEEWPDAPGHTLLKRDRGEFLMCQTVAVTDCALAVGTAVSSMESGAPVPGALEAVVRRPMRLTHDVLALELELSRPIEFEAGQFVLMSAPDISGSRAYSMVNFDRPAERLALVVKMKPGGRMSEWLFGAPLEGSRVALFGPLGGATFHPDMGKNLLCIAGGSGIAGMMSILSRAAQADYFQRHTGHVFFGVRTRRDVFFLSELAAWAARFPEALRVTIALSDEGVDSDLQASYPGLAFGTGFVHAVASERMKGQFDNVRAYAAGPPPMVDATLRVLLVQGKLKPADIRYDKFS